MVKNKETVQQADAFAVKELNSYNKKKKKKISVAVIWRKEMRDMKESNISDFYREMGISEPVLRFGEQVLRN
ncbi:MAG: hypothetical protein ACLVLH_20010 [Eisenbergiella massiliensis]